MFRREFLAAVSSIPLIGVVKPKDGIRPGNCHIVCSRQKPITYQKVGMFLATCLFEKLKGKLSLHPEAIIEDIQIWDDPLVYKQRRWGWYGWITIRNPDGKTEDFASAIDIKMSKMSKEESNQVMDYTFDILKYMIINKYSEKIIRYRQPGRSYVRHC